MKTIIKIPEPKDIGAINRELDFPLNLDHVELDIMRSLLYEDRTKVEVPESEPALTRVDCNLLRNDSGHVGSPFVVSDDFVTIGALLDIVATSDLKSSDIGWEIPPLKAHTQSQFRTPVNSEDAEGYESFSRQYNNTKPKISNSGKRSKRFAEGKPKQPLSAYNFFFQSERARILKEYQSRDEGTDKMVVKQSHINEAQLISEKYSAPRRGRPRGPKYKKRKPKHGKISFQNLAKRVGLAWKAASPDTIAKYKGFAVRDRLRYDAELASFTNFSRKEET